MFELQFVGFIALIVGLKVWVWWKTYGSLPTFDDYCRRHVELVRHGRVKCGNCGGGRVYLHSLDAVRRRHICVACGTVLYRS